MSVDFLDETADIVCAYIGNNHVALDQLPKFIADVHRGIAAAATVQPLRVPSQQVAAGQKPAVNPKRSVFPDHIISLENGKAYKMLKPHLGRLGLTPDAYRRKWGLPASYPMTAPDYAEARSENAKRIGLGNARRADRTKAAKKRSKA
ncbi:MucR family transcriptional regulator [Mesorhizobium sp. RP14(2022)]|uniref:MucR family transcriptional regulator n=1 Tax=Mesorhizobium liriopis TaxID=2953882 RepID=A0ABT1C720_9HYPH|nr:MucR family transcriptional regulator [Mesorhizobium liriopis]MCO6050625.1 MucR family transcriptional regulator [Mesorhizobium liriopis]